jgi:hypothetical protein
MRASILLTAPAAALLVFPAAAPAGESATHYYLSLGDSLAAGTNATGVGGSPISGTPTSSTPRLRRRPEARARHTGGVIHEPVDLRDR